MIAALLALWSGPVASWGFADFLIALIVIIGCIAVTVIACRAMGVPIPDWLIQIGFVVLIVVVAIFAIRLIAGM